MLLVLLAHGVASATVPDLFGLGARWQGMGGGGVAVVDDGTAAFVNPAGLSFVRRPTAGIGYIHGWPRFAPIPPLWWDTNRDGRLDEADPPLTFDANPAPMSGFQVQASRNVGGKFGLGFTAYVPSANLIRFAMIEPSLPNYIMYDNRPQRFVAAASIGGEVLPGVALGVGANLLAKAKIRIGATLAAGIDPPETTTGDLSSFVSDVTIDVHDIDFRVVPAVAPLAGVQLDLGKWTPALKGLVVGAAYQGRVGLPLEVDLDIQANAEVSGFGDLDPFLAAAIAEASFVLFDHYVPQRLNLGIAYRRADVLTLYVDGRWTDWRGMVLNVARLESANVTSPFVSLDEAVIQDGNEYSITVRSTFGTRMGIELELPQIDVASRMKYVKLVVRGGFGWEPSALVSQGESSAFLDSDRTMYTVGIGVEHWDPFALTDGAVHFDLVGQWHLLARAELPRASEPPRAGYAVAGTGIPVGGSIPVVGGQWSFEY